MNNENDKIISIFSRISPGENEKFDIVKDMCILSGEVMKTIEKTQDQQQKKNLFKKYLEIIHQINILPYKDFKKDSLFLVTIEKIRNTSQVIKQFQSGEIQYSQFLNHLDDIIINNYKILMAWKAENEY
jgi:hypothetical protein